MQEHVFKRRRKVAGKIVSSRCYYGHYTVSGDSRQRTIALDTSDKQVAIAKLREIVQRAEREAAGVGVPRH